MLLTYRMNVKAKKYLFGDWIVIILVYIKNNNYRQF
jgi:hypothetical protein